MTNEQLKNFFNKTNKNRFANTSWSNNSSNKWRKPE